MTKTLTLSVTSCDHTRTQAQTVASGNADFSAGINGPKNQLSVQKSVTLSVTPALYIDTDLDGDPDTVPRQACR